MNAQEAAALLAIAAAFDNRKPDPEAVTAWSIALDGLRFVDCREVIVGHYKRSREWLMPVDVIGGVRRLRDKRIQDYGPIDPPSWLDPDNTRAFTDWKRNAETAIGDGTYEPEPASELKPRDVASLGLVGQKVPRG